MRRDVRTDWTVRDDVRAKLRSSIKRLLIKHGYPPDKQPGAIKLVLEQWNRWPRDTRRTAPEPQPGAESTATDVRLRGDLRPRRHPPVSSG